MLAVTAAQFAITYLPPLQAVFGTRGVPLFDGLLIVGIGAVFFALIETEKQMRLAFRRPGASPIVPDRTDRAFPRLRRSAPASRGALPPAQ